MITIAIIAPGISASADIYIPCIEFEALYTGDVTGAANSDAPNPYP